MEAANNSLSTADFCLHRSQESLSLSSIPKMPSRDDTCEAFGSLSTESSPHKSFLNGLSETTPSLNHVRSYSLMSEPEGDRAMAISRFSLLLSTLKVPGPCDLLLGESSLGSGAQFDVYKKEINGLTRSKIAVAALNNSVDIAAIKIPKFILDS